MKNRKLIAIIICVISVILIIIGLAFMFLRDNGEQPAKNDPSTSEDPSDDTLLKETHTSGDLKIESFETQKKEYKTLVSFKITNDKNKNFNNVEIAVYLFDKDRNIITFFEHHVGDLKASETKNVEFETGIDFSNVYDYMFVIMG